MKDKETKRIYDLAYRSKNIKIIKEKEKLRRDNNKEIFRERKRIFNIKNKDKISKKKKEYYIKNKEKLNAAGRRNYHRNKDSGKAKRKEYAENNAEHIKLYQKEYYNKNTEVLKKYKKEYGELNSEHLKKCQKESNIKNRVKNNKRQVDRTKTDPLFKLKCNLRKQLNKVFRNQLNVRKSNHTFEIIGLQPEELKKYIELKFTKGMSWNNYGMCDGVYGWDIDHIVPLASAKIEEELIKLCHYSNLQPMWHLENIKKGNKMPQELLIQTK